MKYLEEEIDLVRFFEEHLDCETKQEEQCPLFERCSEIREEKGEGNELCRQIVINMQNEEELRQEEKEVISFFFRDGLWTRRGDKECLTRYDHEQCPNRALCDEREQSGESVICQELFNKLGLYEPDEYIILEKEIQKVIINNLNLGNIDWEVGEEVRYYAHESSTPVGRPDILLEGKESKTLYVVELKASLANHKDVGQLQKYVGWYKMNLPTQFKNVRGILLTKEFDEGAKYAILANPNLEARFFELHIDVRKGEW